MADGEAVQQFVGVTGASEAEAAFFLESSGGNVESAILAFFEGGHSAEQTEASAAPANPAPPAAAPVFSNSASRAQAGDEHVHIDLLVILTVLSNR